MFSKYLIRFVGVTTVAGGAAATAIALNGQKEIDQKEVGEKETKAGEKPIKGKGDENEASEEEPLPSADKSIQPSKP